MITAALNTIPVRVPMISNKSNMWWMRVDRKEIVIFDHKPSMREGYGYEINNRYIEHYAVYWDSIEHIKDLYLIPEAGRQSILALDPDKLIRNSVHLFLCWGIQVSHLDSWKDDEL